MSYGDKCYGERWLGRAVGGNQCNLQNIVREGLTEPWLLSGTLKEAKSNESRFVKESSRQDEEQVQSP